MSTTNVELLPTRDLKPGQRTELWIANVEGDAPQLVYTSDDLLLEAPNWAPDGRTLLLNGHGLLWRLNLQPEVTLEQVVDRRSSAHQQRPRTRRSARTDLPLRQRRASLRGPDRWRSSEEGQSRPHSLPLPPWGQSGRHHAGVRRSAAR